MLSIAQVLIGPHLPSISVKTTKIGQQGKYYIENSQNTTVGSKGKMWQIRKQMSGQIGQIVYANPTEGERCFLRVLLNHVRGATSYEDLRTVAGVTYSTFREACEKRGLIETNKSIDDCLTEATTF